MAAKAWEERIGEMIAALTWADFNELEEPTKVVRGTGTKHFVATYESETATGVDQFDAIRNLWQKIGCPEV
jgi:hypothetical protein